MSRPEILTPPALAFLKQLHRRLAGRGAGPPPGRGAHPPPAAARPARRVLLRNPPRQREA